MNLCIDLLQMKVIRGYAIHFSVLPILNYTGIKECSRYIRGYQTKSHGNRSKTMIETLHNKYIFTHIKSHKKSIVFPDWFR